MANTERTFLMCKPDAVQRGLVGDIIARFEKRGYKLVGLKMMAVSEDLAKNHYADLSGRPFFPDLVKFICSSPVVAMCWEGLDVVAQGRSMIGATNPLKSLPGSIRGDFSIEMGKNILHGSDSVESSTRELAMWFTEAELCTYKRASDAWVYE